jgi:hypothetical protein
MTNQRLPWHKFAELESQTLKILDTFNGKMHYCFSGSRFLMVPWAGKQVF